MKIVKTRGTEVEFITPEMKKKDDYILEGEQEDITSVSLIKNSSPWSLNYAEKKDCYQYLGKNFDSLSDDDKKEIVYMCAVDMSTCLSFYINNLNLSEEQAKLSYINNRAHDIVNLANVCKDNAKKSSLLSILLKYMPQSSAEKFLDDCHKLIFNYSEYAVYGKKYGNSIDGILDYIEQYGTYSGAGIGNLTLYNEADLSNLKEELVSLLTNDRSNIKYKIQ